MNESTKEQFMRWISEDVPSEALMANPLRPWIQKSPADIADYWLKVVATQVELARVAEKIDLAEKIKVIIEELKEPVRNALEANRFWLADSIQTDGWHSRLDVAYGILLLLTPQEGEKDKKEDI